jgi:hypothetical protein
VVATTITATGLISGATNYTGFKNRIINGAMVIDQRNAGASVANIAGASYSLDRWILSGSVATKFTIQQNAGSVTPPAGYTKYLGVTSSSAYTVGASERFQVAQRIEGFNIADLGWGTANAATVTLSFWVRSSLTGTFGGSFQNGGTTRAYPYTYTISSANTWEQKTVTIAGDTSGTWASDNTNGVTVAFGLGTGSTYSGTAGAWATADYNNATGATSVVGTNGATFYITGVQLEKGSVATSFDYRPYGTELALCQRYYYKNLASSGATYFAPGFCYSATNAVFNCQFPVPMRTQPTALETTGTVGNYRVYSTSASSFNATAITFNNAETISSSFTIIVASGLTNSAGAFLISNISSAYLAWSAEL